MLNRPAAGELLTGAIIALVLLAALALARPRIVLPAIRVNADYRRLDVLDGRVPARDHPTLTSR